jgi:hypothetical protein
VHDCGFEVVQEYLRMGQEKLRKVRNADDERVSFSGNTYHLYTT